MFDREDDPLYLQSRLEAFIDRRHGYRKPWFGIAAEKIAMTKLPQPLAWLYGFAGEWSGNRYWDTLLGNQDCLVHFEELRVEDGKLIFVNENQGVWQVGTDSSGSDPAVWARIDDGPWELLGNSLMQFLVTFVLHGTIFGCEHFAFVDNAIEQLETAGLHISPLWINHPYPMFAEGQVGRATSFYVANGTYLVMDGMCVSTNVEAPWEELASIFQKKDTPANAGPMDWYSPFPDHLQVPAMMRRSYLENLVRKHEMAVKFHQDRTILYQKMLAEMEDDDSNW